MVTSKEVRRRREKKMALIRQYWVLYVLMIIPVVVTLIYTYYPMVSNVWLSLTDYKIKRGIWKSPFVGLENFTTMFSNPSYTRLFSNTIRISVLSLVFNFFPPIVLAIMLYDLRSSVLRKVSQNILYIPHFFSWVVVYVLCTIIFSSSGYLNALRGAIGMESRDFMMESGFFLPILLISAVWKEVGWNTIIYMAALSSIDMELFEVAKIDGAGPIQRIRYITLPAIRSVVVFLLTMQLGSILSVNTEQILLFYGPHNYSVSDVIGTWVYRQGLSKMQYSQGAALSLFNSVIGMVLVLISNRLAIRFSGRGLW